ncbi:MAG: hypothetical protein LBJ00_11760 [Planctomycetaceae bacterium]|jgi:hypothetical protein|nr:hypothetical protein [Planctomycetaceae bacterium]
MSFLLSRKKSNLLQANHQYAVAGRAIGFTLEQSLHVVTLTCSALGILKVTIQSIEFLSTTENTEFTEVNFKYEDIRKS